MRRLRRNDVFFAQCLMMLAPEFAAVRFAILGVKRLIRNQHDRESVLAAIQRAAAILDDLDAVIMEQDLVMAQHTAK